MMLLGNYNNNKQYIPKYQMIVKNITHPAS